MNTGIYYTGTDIESRAVSHWKIARRYYDTDQLQEKHVRTSNVRQAMVKMRELGLANIMTALGEKEAAHVLK